MCAKETTETKPTVEIKPVLSRSDIVIVIYDIKPDMKREELRKFLTDGEEIQKFEYVNDSVYCRKHCTQDCLRSVVEYCNEKLGNPTGRDYVDIRIIVLNSGSFCEEIIKNRKIKNWDHNTTSDVEEMRKLMNAVRDNN